MRSLILAGVAGCRTGRGPKLRDRGEAEVDQCVHDVGEGGDVATASAAGNSKMGLSEGSAKMKTINQRNAVAVIVPAKRSDVQSTNSSVSSCWTNPKERAPWVPACVPSVAPRRHSSAFSEQYFTSASCGNELPPPARWRLTTVPSSNTPARAASRERCRRMALRCSCVASLSQNAWATSTPKVSAKRAPVFHRVEVDEEVPWRAGGASRRVRDGRSSRGDGI